MEEKLAFLSAFSNGLLRGEGGGGGRSLLSSIDFSFVMIFPENWKQSVFLELFSLGSTFARQRNINWKVNQGTDVFN